MLKLFTNQEIMIMATVVIGLLIIIFSLSLLDIREKIRNKKKIEVENNIEENNINEIEKEEVSNVPPKGSISEVLEEIEILDDEDDIIEVIENDDPFTSPIEEIVEEEAVVLTEQEKAKEELNRVRLELEKEESKEKSLEDTIRLYEAEQENKAIISLEELTKISDEAYENNELRGYEDDLAPISLDEVINHYSTNNNMEFENTATYAKLVREENKQEDFLTQLKNTYHEHEN